MLGQVLASFIHEVAKDEATASPNYTYILFEAAALTLAAVTDLVEFQEVENNLTCVLDPIIFSNKVHLMGLAFQL